MSKARNGGKEASLEGLTVVEDRNDQDHEGWEVELPDQGQQHEAEHDTDGDRHSVDGVVLHALQQQRRKDQRLPQSRFASRCRRHAVDKSFVVGCANAVKDKLQSIQTFPIVAGFRCDHSHQSTETNFALRTQPMGISQHLEDRPACDDGADDNAQARLCEHDVSSIARSVGSISHSDTDVALLESRRVVDSVSSHANDVLLLLKVLDDLQEGTQHETTVSAGNPCTLQEKLITRPLSPLG